MIISWINFIKRNILRPKTNPKFLRELSDMYHKERTDNFRENLRTMLERDREIEHIIKNQQQESYHNYIARRLKETENE